MQVRYGSPFWFNIRQEWAEASSTQKQCPVIVTTYLYYPLLYVTVAFTTLMPSEPLRGPSSWPAWSGPWWRPTSPCRPWPSSPRCCAASGGVLESHDQFKDHFMISLVSNRSKINYMDHKLNDLLMHWALGFVCAVLSGSPWSPSWRKLWRGSSVKGGRCQWSLKDTFFVLYFLKVFNF